jgi:hypothetical protein
MSPASTSRSACNHVAMLVNPPDPGALGRSATGTPPPARSKFWHVYGLVTFTSSDVLPPRFAAGKDVPARLSARAHRPAWVAIYIPKPFQYELGLDRAESK